MKADTGANGSILTLRCFKQMYVGEENPSSKLQGSSVMLTATNGTCIEHYGHIDIPVNLMSLSGLLLDFMCVILKDLLFCPVI